MSGPLQAAAQPFEMDAASETRLGDVYPTLAQRIRNVAQILKNEGVLIRVVQGLRTWGQQDALYAQGRDNAMKIVTNARGGYSWHNFGLAVDCVPSVDGVELAFAPDWDASHPTWKRMENLGVGMGLTSGANWTRLVDAPHFQLTGRFPENAPTDEVRQLFKDGGMQAVWDELEKA